MFVICIYRIWKCSNIDMFYMKCDCTRIRLKSWTHLFVLFAYMDAAWPQRSNLSGNMKHLVVFHKGMTTLIFCSCSCHKQCPPCINLCRHQKSAHVLFGVSCVQPGCEVYFSLSLSLSLSPPFFLYRRHAADWCTTIHRDVNIRIYWCSPIFSYKINKSYNKTNRDLLMRDLGSGFSHSCRLMSHNRL
jgi:hypothetical protein